MSCKLCLPRGKFVKSAWINWQRFSTPWVRIFFWATSSAGELISTPTPRQLGCVSKIVVSKQPEPVPKSAKLKADDAAPDETGPGEAGLGDAGSEVRPGEVKPDEEGLVQ